jgi:hypothetical protein
MDPDDLAQLNRNLEFRALCEQAAELFEETEQKMAAHAEWRERAIAEGRYREWTPPPQEAPPVQRSAPEVINKTHESPAPTAAAPPDEGPFTAAQHDVLAAVISELRREWREAIEAKVDELRAAATRREIDELRTELALLRESIAGRVTIIPPKGKTDAA